jgi:hypothetical protein
MKETMPQEVECILDEAGSRFGPFALLARVGPHAIVKIGETVLPLPGRAIVPKGVRRRRPSSSGERLAAR